MQTIWIRFPDTTVKNNSRKNTQLFHPLRKCKIAYSGNLSTPKGHNNLFTLRQSLYRFSTLARHLRRNRNRGHDRKQTSTLPAGPIAHKTQTNPMPKARIIPSEFMSFSPPRRVPLSEFCEWLTIGIAACHFHLLGGGLTSRLTSSTDLTFPENTSTVLKASCVLFTSQHHSSDSRQSARTHPPKGHYCCWHDDDDNARFMPEPGAVKPRAFPPWVWMFLGSLSSTIIYYTVGRDQPK